MPEEDSGVARVATGDRCRQDHRKVKKTIQVGSGKNGLCNSSLLRGKDRRAGDVSEYEIRESGRWPVYQNQPVVHNRILLWRS